MLTQADLRSIRRVVAHANCHDGILAALFAAERLPLMFSAITFVQYNTPEHVHLSVEPGTLFLDIVPWAERDEDGRLTVAGRAQIQRWVDAGAMVLDHHAGAAETVRMFGERGIYADAVAQPGVSGAALAFDHLRLPSSEPVADDIPRDLARLVGIRDTWQRDDKDFDRASALAAAITFYGFATLNAVLWRHGWPRIVTMLEVGEYLLANERRRAKGLLAHAHRLTVEGKRVVAFEGVSHDASNVADIAPEGTDLIVGWNVFAEGEQTRMTCHLRSRGGVLAKPLALHYGGGGHDHAGGFTVDVDGQDGNPVEHVARLVRHYLWGKNEGRPR